jgi:hypothetical protein
MLRCSGTFTERGTSNEYYKFKKYKKYILFVVYIPTMLSRRETTISIIFCMSARGIFNFISCEEGSNAPFLT